MFAVLAAAAVLALCVRAAVGREGFLPAAVHGILGRALSGHSAYGATAAAIPSAAGDTRRRIATSRTP